MLLKIYIENSGGKNIKTDKIKYSIKKNSEIYGV